LVIRVNNDSSAAFRQSVRVGSLSVAFRPSGGLTSLDGSSPACNATSLGQFISLSMASCFLTGLFVFVSSRSGDWELGRCSMQHDSDTIFLSRGSILFRCSCNCVWVDAIFCRSHTLVVFSFVQSYHFRVHAVFCSTALSGQMTSTSPSAPRTLW
jgi:hypothetical protein